MKKKIFATMLVIILSMSLGTILLHAADAVPYAMTCTCGGSLNARTVKRDAWQTYEPVKCSKYPNYYDSKQKRDVHTTFICTQNIPPIKPIYK